MRSTFLALAAAIAASGVSSAQAPTAAAPTELPRVLGFEPDGPGRFRVRQGELTAWATPGGLSLALIDHGSGVGAALRLDFEDSDAAVAPRGVAPLAGPVTRIVPGAPSVRTTRFASLLWPQLYAGIDLVARDGGGRLEYDLVLAPGAPLEDVVVRVDGADALTLEADGTLVVHTAAGELRQGAPRTWQIAADGTELPLACHFELRGADRFGFVAPGRERSLVTIVDPVVAYSTYLGGRDLDEAFDVDVDSSGAAYVVGRSTSSDFPTTPGAFDATDVKDEVVVVKVAPDGSSLEWATFVGGEDHDAGRAVAVDVLGRAHVAGTTESEDFPVTEDAWQDEYVDDVDAFVLRLAPDGASLEWSTFLGGSDDDVPNDMGLDLVGNVFVVGETTSTDFPLSFGAAQGFQAGGRDGFAAKLTPSGSLLAYSTFLGGGGHDEARGVAVDDVGRAHVVGRTRSNDFPVTAWAHDGTRDGDDAFVCRVSDVGDQLEWSTLLGGSRNDEAFGCAVAPSGDVWVTGRSTSSDFPTTLSAFGSETKVGRDDAFLTRVDASGSLLDWSTYVGGSGDDSGADVAVDSSGRAFVVGTTHSNDFALTPDAFRATRAGGADAFFLQVSPDGETLEYGTLAGGPRAEVVQAVAHDESSGASVMVGRARESFPTTGGAFDTSFDGGNGDAFVVRFGANACGALAAVAPLSAPCGADLDATPPVLGSTLTLDVVGATPSGTGCVVFSAPGAAPTSLEGCAVHVDPTRFALLAVFAVDPSGAWSSPFALPSDPGLCGAQVVLQGAVLGAGGPLSFGQLTDALLLTLGGQ